MEKRYSNNNQNLGAGHSTPMEMTPLTSTPQTLMPPVNTSTASGPALLFFKKNWKLKERLFTIVLVSCGISVLLIVSGIITSLFLGSLPAIGKYGIHFILGNEWDPASGRFGAFPFIIGTLLTATLALAISLPFSLSISMTLGEYFQKGRFSAILKSMVELLAGIPSVIYGFWGSYFIIPVIQQLEMKLGITPYGVGIMSASIVLAIMIIPYSASIARDVLSLVPNDLKEAAYSLGATRFEVVTKISIPYSISGIIAGIVLALGRALGETMAVTMLIGNMNIVPENLFSPGQTIASVIANQFNEAGSDLHRSAMIELGLILLAVTILINLAGKFIIKQMCVRSH
jgi:phosphate transport system permease protein